MNLRKKTKQMWLLAACCIVMHGARVCAEESCIVEGSTARIASAISAGVLDAQVDSFFYAQDVALLSTAFKSGPWGLTIIIR